MTIHQALQPGAAEPSASAPRGDGAEPRQAQQSARPRAGGARTPAPRAAGHSAAFGVGSGAAVVFRDLASL